MKTATDGRDDDPVESSPPGPAPGRVTRRQVRVAVVVVVLPATAARWVTSHGSFFAQDDLLYFADARSIGSRGEWLFKTWFGHLAPLHRMWFSVAAPTDSWWDGLLAVQLALVAVSSWILYLAFERLFGVTPWLVPAIGLVAFTPILELPTLWPSAGLQQIPNLTANAAALYAVVRFLESTDRRWVAGPRLSLHRE